MSKLIRRSDLVRIHNVLLGKLSSEDKEWLMVNRKAWTKLTDFQPLSPKVDAYHFPNGRITFDIEDMIDAIRRNWKRPHIPTNQYKVIPNRTDLDYHTSLTVSNLFEIQEILGIHKDSHDKNEMIQQILETIPPET